MTLHEAPPVKRVAVLSVHTSPLDQPGTGDGGGLNVYVREVSRRLVRRGVAVDVFTRLTSPDADPVVTTDGGFRVHHVPAGPPRPVDKDDLPNLLCPFLLGLEQHVTRHAGGPSPGFDVVHAHYWLSGWVGRRLRRRWQVPLVQSFHTLGRVKNAALAPGDRPEPAVRLVAESHLVDEADRILVPVCEEARWLHRAHGTSGARLSVVQPGVDLDIFHPGPAPAPEEAPPGRGPLLLFVGRLQPLKGPDVAVATLARIRRRVPDARLLVIGGTSGSGAGRSGPRQLRALARRHGVAGAVAFGPARPQAELADLYRAAAVVLVPSRSESFGLVALEAQACGTPVVAADVGGLRAVVGRGGTLVAGHDPVDHAAAVLALLEDPAHRDLVGRAAAAAARRATWDRTVERLLDVYRSVTDAAGRSAEALDAVRMRGAGA